MSRALEEVEVGRALGASSVELLAPELQALIEGIQGRAPEPRDVEWDRLKSLAIVHGVAPLLHRAWRDLPGIVPQALLDDFKQMRRESALNGALGFRQRDDVLDMLRQAAIPCLVLKGAALAYVWYQDLSLRPFLDIDLLLPVHEIKRARDLLIQSGYADGPDWEASHHERPLFRAGMPCVIELHYDLTRLTRLPPLLFEDLYKRSIFLGGTDSHVRTLGPEDTLLHLCLHLLAHLEQDHGWKLRYFCDISRHLETYDIDWQLFDQLADTADARRGCTAVLGLTDLLVGIAIPIGGSDVATGQALLRYPVPGEIDHRFLAAFLKALSRADLRNASAMLLMSASLRGRGERVRIRELHPYRLVPIVGRLLREIMTHPTQLRYQLRLWLPQATHWDERQRLLADLTTSHRKST